MLRKVVDPEWIKQQRELGWPDMHPEDFCHRCGAKNPTWYVDTREQWLDATKEWSESTGREGICCPTCILEMYEETHPGYYTLKIHIQRLDKP